MNNSPEVFKMNSVKKIFSSFVVFVMLLNVLLVPTSAAEKTGIWPVPTKAKSSDITQYFGYNAKTKKTHGGIDIAGSGERVYASQSGTIFAVYTGCANHSALDTGKDCVKNGCKPSENFYPKKAEFQTCNNGAGNGVIIYNKAENLYYKYSHMETVAPGLKKGASIEQGTYLGIIGSSGNANGPHLHFEIIEKAVWTSIGGVLKNPLDYVAQIDWRNGTATLPQTTQSSYPPTVTTTEVRSITQTNAVVYGSVSKSVDTKITAIGIYLGTSSSNLTKAASESPSSSSNAKTSFNIWYDLNQYGTTLKSGTTYYWQCFATYNGVEYKGAVKSFTTLPSTSSTTPPTVTTTEVKNITQTNAVVYGSVSKATSMYISAIGIYLGTSSSSLTKVASESPSSSSNAKTSFDIWYDLNQYGTTLKPGTTYYWQCFATYNGVEYKGAIKSFTTLPSTSQLSVLSTVDGIYTVTIPANLTLDCYPSQTATTRSSWITSSTTSYQITCTQQLNMSDGTIRYRFVSGDNPPKDLYFEFTSSMRVEIKSNQPGTVTIQYNANGGTGAPSSHVVNKNQNGVVYFDLSTAIPTRVGYTFIGWRLNNDAQDDIYGQGRGLSMYIGSITSNDTITFYAQWQTEIKTYGTVTIQYNANGGSGAPSSHTITKDQYGNIYFSIPIIEPTRSGYTFLGWRLFNDSAYDIVVSGERIGLETKNAVNNETLTYYAQWKTGTSTARPSATFSNASTGWDGSSYYFQFSYKAEGNIINDVYITTQTDIGNRSSDEAGPWGKSDSLRQYVPADWFTVGKTYNWVITVDIDGELITSQIYSFVFRKPY